MSVAVNGKNVDFNHGGKAIQIPCKDSKEASKVAAEMQKVEDKMISEEKKLGLTPEQFMANLQQATLQKGVGENLDKSA